MRSLGAAVLILGAATPAWPQDAGKASSDTLPPAPVLMGPLHRGADGTVELLDATKEEGSAPRRCGTDAICVGPGQAYASLEAALAVARPGATIEMVAATYRETDRIAIDHLTVRGIDGTPHFDCAGLKIAGDKACLLLAANGITLDNLEISGAVIPDADGANGACVRNDPDLDFTLRRVLCHGSQDGVLTDGGTILVEESQFYDNGWTDRTHNAYFSGKCRSVTVRGSTFRDARVGHELKSRCERTEISDSTFESTKGSRDIDLPDGGDATIYRSTIAKREGAESAEIIGFTEESCLNQGDLVLKDVKIVNEKRDADIKNYDACPGRAIVFEGTSSSGLPVRELGYILHR